MTIRYVWAKGPYLEGRALRSTGLGARQDDHFLYCGRPDFEVNFPSLIVKCM